MNVPPSPPDDPPPGAAAPVPATGEFVTVWVAYGCFFFGVLLWWPSLIGLVIAYARRGEPAAGFIDTHYRWLIRSFWWASAGGLVALAVIAAGAWPIVADVLRSVQRRGGDWHRDWHGGDWEVAPLVNLDWDAIFAAAGLAVAGGCALVAVILWLLYRLIRGALRLADAQPAP